MATLTIRIPDDKHSRLKELARNRGMSVNKLIEELSTICLQQCFAPALTEYDTYHRFQAIAATGNPDRGLELLAKLDSLNAEKP
jgi:predicted transcriptional regulator